jgi:hypothetical protein
MVLRADAQTNSWTNSAGGKWEDASWSLGVIPGTNQTVLITNAGWKAVQIAPSTAQNFANSLNVDTVEISSPTNTFNTLLMNFAGPGTPLTVKELSVASNSAMTMLSSALQINGPSEGGMMVGGLFNQTNSTVSGNQIILGNIGPGVYNFDSGTLNVSHLWTGGNFSGLFNQNGGTNAFGITHLDGGQYVLSNGFYAATIYFDGGTFNQQGGVLKTNVDIFEGNYLLAGGTHLGETTVPITDGFSSGHGGVMQTGGTNNGRLDIGSEGYGSYTMSNGVSIADYFLVDYEGTYEQWAGSQTVAGPIVINEALTAGQTFTGGSFILHGGTVSSTGMSVGAYYTQTGGTNFVAGDVGISDAETLLSISGGLLTVNNLTAQPGFSGGVFLTGGTLAVTNDLNISGNNSFPGWQGFVGGGHLIVSNIWLGPQSKFSCATGAIDQSGLLTLASSTLNAGSGPMRFGSVFLSSTGATNSTLVMPVGASIVRFANSSGVLWSNGSVLMVENWSGSLAGSGQQQIIFGNSTSALTAQQLAQIQFLNPAGLVPGAYAARILATGEIVPDPGVARFLTLNRQSNGMQLMLQGQIGSNYSIEASTDLVHWMAITSQIDTNGTFFVTDTNAPNFPTRFYRTKLVP